MYGINNAELATITSGGFEGLSSEEIALLRMADALAETPANVSDELYSELRRHFSEEQLIELSAVAGYENMRARSNRVFDVGSDGLCSIVDHRDAAAALTVSRARGAS